MYILFVLTLIINIFAKSRYSQIKEAYLKKYRLAPKYVPEAPIFASVNSDELLKSVSIDFDGCSYDYDKCVLMTQHAARFGFNAVKVPISWRRISKVKFVDDDKVLMFYRRFFQYLHTNHWRYTIVMSDPPTWSYNANTKQFLIYFGTYVSKVMHYVNASFERVQLFSGINNPNRDFPKIFNASDVTVLEGCAQTVRRYNPNVTIILDFDAYVGGLTYKQNSILYETFLNDVCRTSANVLTANFHSGSLTLESLSDISPLNTLIQMTHEKEFTCFNKKIAIEVGYPTPAINIIADQSYNLTEENQVQYINDLFNQLQLTVNEFKVTLEYMNWRSLVDLDKPMPSPMEVTVAHTLPEYIVVGMEKYFGVLRSDYTPKPGGERLRQALQNFVPSK